MNKQILLQPPSGSKVVAEEQKVRRRPRGMTARCFVRFFLMLVVMLTLPVQKASAAYPNWDNSWIHHRYNPVNATLELDIRVYQHWGGMGNGHCGFCREDGSLNVEVAGYSITLKGPDESWTSLDKNSDQVKGIDYKYVKWLGEIEDEAHYLRLIIPLKNEYIGKDVPVKYNGTWWRKGATLSNNSVSYNTSIDTRFGCVQTVITGGRYGVQNNTPGYFIDWKKNGTASSFSIDNYGTFVLCAPNGDEIDGTGSFTAINKSGSFFVPTSKMSLDNFADYKVKQKYTPIYNKQVTYSTLSDSYTRPAYPQVKEVNANYDQVTRKIKVNWTLSAAPTQNCIEDQMELAIKRTEEGTNIVDNTTTNIAYLAGRTAYSYELEVPLGKSYKYEFNVKRSHTKNYAEWNNMYSKSTSLSASAHHSTVSSGSVHAALNADNKTATITWSTEGNIWSSGTKAVLTRINVTTNTTDNIELTKEQYQSGKYVDDMIMVCNEYRYRLTVKPAEAYGTLPTVAAPESVMPTSIGNLVTFTAAKGYYTDRIELAWSSHGNFERFVINRKEHGAPDTDYKQIAVTEGNEAQNDYYYSDVNAIPGIVYDYRIRGQVMCSGNLLESAETLTDVGFRTPTGDIYGRVTFESGQAVADAKVSAEPTEGSGISGKAYVLDGTASLTVDNDALLKDATDAATLEAWVRPAGDGVIVEKQGMYSLAYRKDKIEFSVGSQTIKSKKKVSTYTKSASYVHVSAVASATHLYIYQRRA